MLTRDETIAAYRSILGRDPTSEEELLYHYREHANLAELRSFLLSSPEFSPGSLETNRLSPATAFETVYGRKPDATEVQRLSDALATIGARTPTEILRTAVTAFDRRDYPTPVSVRFGESDLRTIAIDEGSKRLVLDRQDFAISSTIIATSDYEGHLTRFIRVVVEPGMTCVDIGANVGFHTMVMANLVGTEGHVYAIEPNSENCRMLLLSVAENALDNIHVLPIALSDRPGAVAFSPAIGSNGNFLSLFGNADDPLRHPNCSIVPTFPLDSIIDPDRLDFIKIDVEGAEALALAGALSLIEKHRPVITSEFSEDMLEAVSEVSAEDYLRRMMAPGYRAYTIDGRRGPLEEISDPATFMSNWPNRYHIADLAFVPLEHPFDFPKFAGL